MTDEQKKRYNENNKISQKRRRAEYSELAKHIPTLISDVEMIKKLVLESSDKSQKGLEQNGN